MLVKDEIYDFGYNSEWINEIEHQENNAAKSRFNFNTIENNIIKTDVGESESLIYNDLMESFKEVSIENGIDLPINSFENELYGGPFLTNQDFQHDIYRGFNHGWDIGSEPITMPPNSDISDPILAVEKPTSTAKPLEQTNENLNNIENVGDEYNSELWLSEFEEMKNLQREKAYSFTPDNEMDSIGNPLAEGKRRLENGELPTAVLCFEAAVKQNPSNAEAWQLLGTTQAENEQDLLAINALNKCIKLQPDNLTAVLCLAACYTNESCNLEACKMLMEWLIQNPKYSDIIKSKTLPKEDSNLMKYLFTSKLYELVKSMYIEAAQRSLETGDIDADVQNGLGVLLNLNNESDKAIDCFKAALQVKPEDARLWNRLGATLANGGRCEEAIEAYHNALQLCPGFVRARYNLGITCIHLDTYREAIEHLLEALNQQASAVSKHFKSPSSSDTIWSTLRLAISMDGQRPDLLKAVNYRNLDLLNKEFKYNGSNWSNPVNDN